MTPAPQPQAPDPFFARGIMLFWALVALYGAAAFALAADHGLAAHFRPVMYLGTAGLFTLALAIAYLGFLVLRAYYVMIVVRPPRLAAWLWADLKQGPLNRVRLAGALAVFPGFILVFSIFTSMKMMIPALHPFAWDETLSRLDHTLHFGHDPWRILQPVMGFPVVTWLVNLVYNFWLPMVFITLYWQLFSLKDAQARMHFFCAFVLTWAVNGTFLAVLFSSAGPCYFRDVTGHDYYAPLMHYLHEASARHAIFALTTQKMLWHSYKTSTDMIGGGISAMPSIHVSTALLFLLLSRRLKSRFWPLYAAFFACIFFGSVHLAWHYAVDGYAAIALTMPLWLASGWLVGRLSRTAA